MEGEIDAGGLADLEGQLVDPGALVGTDEESDEALRQRCRDALGALSPNGPKEAYAYVAKSATRPTDGSLIGVNRVSVSADTGTGVVTVYVADPDGPLALLDLGYVNDEIQLKVVPIGITANVLNAVPITQPITVTVWAHRANNVTQAGIMGDISNALVAHFQTIPIGGDQLVEGGTGYIVFSELVSIIDNSNSAIYRVALSVPAADVVLLVLGGSAALLSLAQARAVLRGQQPTPFELPSVERFAAANWEGQSSMAARFARRRR